ncbi:MAG: glycoside hydrolase family 31 protein [Clostridia bacterium]|nr:glycoside hydrolase family 31 protein [Clostridia bacterium]
MTLVSKISENIYRIRHFRNELPRESLLSKYGIINTCFDGNKTETEQYDGDTVSVGREEYKLCFLLSSEDSGGFDIKLSLDKNDRLFGLGDESRNCMEKHGKIAHIKTENVYSYGPMPYLMSSRGWAILVNCTYEHVFDIASTEFDKLHIYGAKGALDIFVFCGKDMKEALYLSGLVIGRPVMLPKGAYGLTVVLNEQTNAQRLLDYALRFKERDIPCDILGLEPSWMSKHYDFSTEKSWNRERFPIPYWKPENYYGSWSFIWNLHKMGKMLSLWLCNDYDLFWKEEGDFFREEKKDFSDAAINDPHFFKGRRLDTLTKSEEPWFEHLKKFVDNGAEAFKLDGACQIDIHPDRLWAGRYTDDEIHNLYPVVYAKQMKEGYEQHTGKRAMINTCGSYPGIQKYAATWAGDTGCTPSVLLSLMNFAMCGHSNTSFDMESDAKEKIHIGFLAPWSQHMGWENYLLPWYCGDEIENCYRYYAQLRSSLFPYIYSFAAYASKTSYPLLRPLCLAYSETAEYDKVYNEYMLGDSLLVSAFDTHVVLPEQDEWYDFYTGKLYTGEKEFDYVLPENKGGAVFVRAGSIVPMQPHAPALRDYRPEKLYIHVYPGKDTSFELYEDDYSTYAYQKGESAVTKFELKNNVLYINSRQGSFEGMPEAFKFIIVWHHPDGTQTNICAESSDSTVMIKAQ